MKSFFKVFLIFFIFLGLVFILRNLIFKKNSFEINLAQKKVLFYKEIKKEKNEPSLSFKKETKRPKIKIKTPKIVKAIYLTSWSASNKEKIRELIKLKKEGKINSVVIDIKDWSGFVFYKTDLEELKKYGTERILIEDIESFLELLHQEKIYVIGRIVVFQDPALAKARKDLALKRISKKDALWFDNLNLVWVDPASKEVWEYNLKIAQDALKKGFDEINFDYIRFPSDGDLNDIKYPFWDKRKSKREVIEEFFRYLRKNLASATLSIDIFGMATVREDDLGIGQVLEDAFKYFDYVCPMIYPSHFEAGFLGYKNPAQYPYEVIKHTLKEALKRLMSYSSSSFLVANFSTSSTSSELNSLESLTKKEKKFPKIRPWLQDFDLGADYDEKMVRLEIEATKEALGENFSGFMLWNPRNIYSKEALK